MSNNTFNPREHLISIKNRQGATEYLPVQYRVAWFRSECPEGTIETELLHLDLDRETEEEVSVWNAEKRRSEKVVKTAKGLAIFRATIKDGKGGSATATKMEKAASFPDFVSKAETGAVGRALALLGYGNQFVGPEEFFDDPVSQVPARSPVNGTAPELITESQITTIRKFCTLLGKEVPQNLSSFRFLDAKQMLEALTNEFNTRKRGKSVL